ncbi:MAG: hypothetical protein J4215_02560 [Candidatus Diapherotrites archaeon]|uniref:Uncharacterized protein n=1 Tax=Candidatus Iainarchaeum sp. TaxID=3101447 RepID=A0A8T4L6E3_9ARCH|nr:hypothetical protein [Candidatus Diapherotrites archaeon]
MNPKGQFFEPFNILIAAVMGLAILVIIIGLIQYFENEKFLLSKERFEKTLDRAFQTPTNEVITEPELLFRAGEQFSSVGLARRRGLEPECIELESRETESISSIQPGVVLIKQNTQLNVYYLCSPASQCLNGCNTCCRIGFGLKPN